jgi:hypothetical protein
VNGLFSAYSGAPFTITAPGTSLQMDGSNQVADQVKPKVEILGEVGPGKSWFDPLAFRAVTEPRFGTAGFNSLRGPGFVNFDLSIFRQFALAGSRTLQFRVEIFNVSNTPHFASPSGNGANVSQLQLNPDGSIRNLGGFSSITSTANSGREGIDERLIRVGLRYGF